MIKILLIEDEVKTVQSLKLGLEENGFYVDVAYDGEMGKQLALRNDYDLIISDLIIPGINGLELCKSLRKEGLETPILMLTALNSTEEKIEGLEAGADDYLGKPFDFKEFLARVKALLRRSLKGVNNSNKLVFQDLELDIENKSVYRNQQLINLTVKEFQLLEYLMRNQGKVVSKSEIAEKIWEMEEENTNLVEVYVNYLRKKVDKNFDQKLIHTQFGMGYVLRSE
ncbi:MAG: hypothetical protein RIR51_2144 [Bacteroidota bacterium]